MDILPERISTGAEGWRYASHWRAVCGERSIPYCRTPEPPGKRRQIYRRLFRIKAVSGFYFAHRAAVHQVNRQPLQVCFINFSPDSPCRGFHQKGGRLCEIQFFTVNNRMEGEDKTRIDGCTAGIFRRQCAQSPGEGTGHIPQAADFYKRFGLGGCKKYFQRRLRGFRHLVQSLVFGQPSPGNRSINR